MYFYAVANWYTDGNDNDQQSSAKLLAHQYPTAYAAFSTEWAQQVPSCQNGSSPAYLLETVEPAESEGYAYGDLYDAYYTSLDWYNCGEPSQAHSFYGSGAQLYATCGGGDVTEHTEGGPDNCPIADVDPEKSRGAPPADCACSETGDSSNKTVGDPVNPATGDKFDTLTLYQGTGPFPLDLTLSFSSMTGTSSALDRVHQVIGRQRIHSYMRTIRVSSRGDAATAYVLRPDGKTLGFDRNGTAWAADADITDRLVASYDSAGNISAWTYRTVHGDAETYDANGTLTSIQHDGFVQTMSADASGRLSQVTDSSGRTLDFSYGPEGLLQSIGTPDGTIALAYDANENVSRVTWPDATHRDYLYAEPSFGNNLLPHNLTGVIDESGVRVDNTTYDDYEHVLSDFGPSGTGTTSLSYGSSPDGYIRTTITQPLGSTEQVDYAHLFGVPHVVRRTVTCAGCTSQVTTYTYDANGRLTSRTRPNGETTSTTYDANGLLTQEVNAQGSVDQRTIDTTWDATFRNPLTRTVLDNQGKVLSWEGWSYNSAGLMTARCLMDPAKSSTYTCTDAGTGHAGVRRTVMTYCTVVDATACPLVGLLLKVDGPRTDVTDVLTYTYYLTTDESGCTAVGGSCHRAGDLQSITDGTGLVTTYASYDRTGRPVRVKAPNGVVTDYAYTSRGWLASKTVRANASDAASSADAVTTVTYDPSGTVHSITDPDNVATVYTYDAAHRLTDITDASGNRIHYILDAAGNRTSQQILASTGTPVRSLSGTFNNLGQLTALTDGLGRVVFSASFADSYDGMGNLVRAADSLGVQHKNILDGLNRLTSTIRDYQGASQGTANAQSVTTFDALDRATGFSDPDGLNTTNDFDAFGNVSTVNSPDTGASARSYDIVGNVTAASDAANISHTSTFDANSRLLKSTYADTTANLQFKYDEADTATGCTGNYGRGHVTRVIENNGGILWCYDGRGNVVSKRQTLGTTTRTTTYTWTLANRLKSVTTPNGTVISYARNALGQITSVQATPSGGPATTVVSGAVYQPFGPLASYKLGDGQTVSLTYDAAGALTDITSNAFSLHMTRDAMGNITAIGDAPGAANPLETYSYDPLYRLTGVKAASGSPIESYTYNKTGDRLTKTAPGLLTGSYAYAAGTHHLTGVGTTARQVDPRGNTTANALASGTFGFGYSPRNRLTVVQNNGVTVGSYVLNAFGERIQKTATGISTRFDYDEDSRLISEAAGTVARDYIWMDTLPIGVVDRTESSATVNFVHADGLGSPRAVTNATGTVLWQWAYASNPFGEKAPTSASEYVLNLRFPGQYFDAESGLAYNINRDYEAASGRYIQSDPIGLAGGLSTFSYALANPARQADLLGLVTGVTVWQPVGWGESSFGHISTNINGTTYSFGPKGMTVIATDEYLSKNSFRDGTEVTLNLTPEQEKMLKDSLMKSQGDYSPLKNNCGSPLQRGLKSLGIDTGNQTLPVSIGNQLLDMGVTDGVIDHAPSNPSNGTNAPWAR